VCKHGGEPEGGYRRSIPDSFELDVEPTAEEAEAAQVAAGTEGTGFLVQEPFS